MNKKCISPIIAVVLLITITLTAASLLRVWYFNEQQQSQERTSGLIDKKIQEKEEEIDIESYDTNGTLYIRNTGLTTINTDSIEIYEEENPLSGYTFSTSTLYSGDILAIWNLTLTIGKTYRITTEIGYTEIFEYNVGNVFLYSDDETIFNNGDSTTITAVTVDNFDNRVGNIDVTFQTTLGTFSESGTSTYTTSTNPSGEATATLVSDTNIGRAKISALAGNYTSMTSVSIEYWWDSSWTKRKKITITENSGNDLTDYQIKFTIDYDADMQPDYDDLRFVDSEGNLLDYWIETSNPANAVIWVKIPSIPESSTTIVYMYYGNAGVSTTSSYESTFTVVGEAGITNVGGTTATVNLTNAYSNPQVFAVPRLPASTYRSGGVLAQHHLITNISGNSFDIVQVESPSSGDGTINPTDISYIVLEQGIYYIGTDLLTEVGTTTSTGPYVTVDFTAPFTSRPIVLADTQTNVNFTDQIYTRGGSITTTQYTVQVEEDDNTTPSLGFPETIAYAAIEEGTGTGESIETENTGDGYSNTFTTWSFSLSYSTPPIVIVQLNREDGSNSCYAVTRDITTIDFELAGEEPASWDGTHTGEEFSWMSIPSGTIYGREYVSPEPTYTMGNEVSYS